MFSLKTLFCKNYKVSVELNGSNELRISGEVIDEKHKPSPLVQGGLEIMIHVKIEWNSEKNLAIFKSKIESVQYPIHDDYMDDSKEIKDELLKEFKNLEVDSSDDEDVSEEVQESGNYCIVLTD